MNDKFFIDSNILVYAFVSQDEFDKISKAKEALLLNKCFISPQVVFEWINVARRKFKYSKDEYLFILHSIFESCEILEENKDIVELSLELLKKHSLQPFDAKIIATALFHNCTVLYSEDMQNGLVIENKLTIVNPFLDK